MPTGAIKVNRNGNNELTKKQRLFPAEHRSHWLKNFTGGQKN
jgi:hypothetical protein